MSRKRPSPASYATDTDDDDSDMSTRIRAVPFGKHITAAEQKRVIDTLGPIIQGEAGYADPPLQPLDICSYRYSKSATAVGEEESEPQAASLDDADSEDADLRMALADTETKTFQGEAAFEKLDFCYLCEYCTPSEYAAVDEAKKTIDKLVKDAHDTGSAKGTAYVVRSIYQVYNTFVRPLTKKDWTVASIDAHLCSHAATPAFALRNRMVEYDRLITILNGGILERSPDGNLKPNLEVLKTQHQLTGRFLEICKALGTMQKTSE